MTVNNPKNDYPALESLTQEATNWSAPGDEAEKKVISKSDSTKNSNVEKDPGQPEKVEMDAPHPTTSNMGGETSKKNPSPIKFPGGDESLLSDGENPTDKLDTTEKSKPPTDLRKKLENKPVFSTTRLYNEKGPVQSRINMNVNRGYPGPWIMDTPGSQHQEPIPNADDDQNESEESPDQTDGRSFLTKCESGRVAKVYLVWHSANPRKLRQRTKSP